MHDQLALLDYLEIDECLRQERVGRAFAKRRERAEWDRFGHHLSGQCGYGGWRIKRHDDVVRVIMRYL